MKTIMTLAGLASIALGASVHSASADWEYTRWGMTPEEVAKASNGDVTLQTGVDRTKTLILAKGNITLHGYDNEVGFVFSEANKLERVIVEVSRNILCTSMMDEFTSRRGAYELTGQIKEGIAIRRWWQPEKFGDNTDRVTMINRVHRSFFGFYQPYYDCTIWYEKGDAPAAASLRTDGDGKDATLPDLRTK